MLMKLATGVNFINILCKCFLYEILAPKITKPNLTREKQLNLSTKNMHVKCCEIGYRSGVEDFLATDLI